MTKSAALLLVLSLGLATQPSAMADAIQSIEEKLRERNVELTKEALVAALSHQELEVRWLAGQKLSQDGVKEAIPALKKALEANSNWQNKLNLGVSLARLGDDFGFSTLRETCSAAEPTYLRLIAARYLIDRGDFFCFDAILKILAQGSAGLKAEALSLLPKYQSVNAFQEQSGNYILEALKAKQLDVRLEAVTAVKLLGTAVAIPALEVAAERETNEWLRARMLEELVRLKAEVKTEVPKQ